VVALRGRALGQGDIYVATPGTQGRWSVVNVGAPVSSAAYEYEAEVARDGRTLVLVANRGDRSHLYRFRLEDGRWVEKERIAADMGVFQVGPLLSPNGDRLLFAQADGERSGELFLVDLERNATSDWPPRCAR
jgi:Tol biopolymer transport system component